MTVEKADSIGLEVLLTRYREAIEWHQRAERKLRDVEAELAAFGKVVDEMAKQPLLFRCDSCGEPCTARRCEERRLAAEKDEADHG